jgi:putative flippase GtrA
MTMFNRYIINGLLATGVHYAVLVLLLEVVQIDKASVANLMAAVLGITTSFLGSRYFVFQKVEESAWQQILRFVPLYALIAGIHTCVMWVWTDHFGWNYTLGFLLATGLQMAGSFLGNKYLVFKT